jgi:hypothetical protein
VNSPTYGILSPVVANTKNTVENFYHFAEFVIEQILVSFDVVSLFIKVPVDLAIKVAEKRLKQDATLSQRTSLRVFLSQHHILCV